MSLLQVINVKRSYGALEVLRGVDFAIEAGDKMGLVGRNGEGKSTLLRCIEGEETPESGEVRVSRGLRLGYVVQRPEFAPGVTPRQYVVAGLDEVHRTEAELNRVGELMGEAEGDAMDKLVKRYGELTEHMEFLGGWDAERRVEAVMHGIGLDEELWDREANTLSGGEKSRTALSRQLVAMPDLLLLDEPTNHLDLEGIEWIEDYLREFPGAVLIVSHDRRLLERTVTSIGELERGVLTRYPGNYSKYLALKAERFETDYRNWKNQSETIRKEESFIKKHMGSQRTAEAKGRQKKLSHIVRLKRPYNDVRRPTIRMAASSRGGELVLTGENLSGGYPGNTVFSNAEVRIGRGERIGVVGPNGAGKTTLLKILAGRATPLAGELNRGYKATCGFFDQDTSELRDDSSPFLEIRRARPEFDDLQVRSHLARFLFRGSDVDSDVSKLSGGERARLSLAMLVLTEPSWLAMDEPTNHLDLAARTAMEEMLGDFEGALVCISHDREFLDGICTRMLEVKDGKIRAFRGNYSAYRAALEAEREDAQAAGAKRKEAEKKTRRQAEERAAKSSKKQGKQKGKQKNKGQQRTRNPFQFKQLEESIMALEAQRDTVQAQLSAEDTWKQADLMRDLQFRLSELERDLEQKNAEWERWS